MKAKKLYSEMGADEILKDIERRKSNGEKRIGYRHLVTKAIKQNEILKIRKRVVDILKIKAIKVFDSLELAMDYINDIDMVDIFPEARENNKEVRAMFRNLSNNMLGNPKRTDFSKAKKMYFTMRNGLTYSFLLSELLLLDKRHSSKEESLRKLLREADITVKAPGVEEFVKNALKNKETIDILSEEDIPYFNTMLSKKVLDTYKTFLDIAISKSEAVVKDGKFVFFLADSYLANSLDITYGRSTVNKIMRYLEELLLVTRVNPNEASEELLKRTSKYHEEVKKSKNNEDKLLDSVKFYRVDNLAEKVKSGDLADKINNLYHIGVRYSSITKDQMDYINNYDRLFDSKDLEFLAAIELVDKEKERYTHFKKETEKVEKIIKRQLENDGLIIKNKVFLEYTEGLNSNNTKEKAKQFKMMIDKILLSNNLVPICRESMSEELKAMVSSNGRESIYKLSSKESELSLEETLAIKDTLDDSKKETYERILEREMSKVIGRVEDMEEEIENLSKEDIDKIIDDSKDNLTLNRKKLKCFIESLSKDKANQIMKNKNSPTPPKKLSRKELRERDFVKRSINDFIDYMRKDFNYGKDIINQDVQGIKRVCNKRKDLINKHISEVRKDYQRGLAKIIENHEDGAGDIDISNYKAKFDRKLKKLIRDKKEVVAIQKGVDRAYKDFLSSCEDAF